MEFLLTKAVVVTLAVLGAVFSSSASLLQVRGYVSTKTAKAINWAGYALMGVSMLLFVLAGLWA